MEVGSINYTSPASVETNSAFQPVDVATARWFGMLADDADFDFAASNRDQVPGNRDPQVFPTQGSNSWTQSQTGFDTSADAAIDISSPSVGGVLDSSSRDRLPWQSPAALSLNNKDLRLFDTFVQLSLIHI